MKFLLASFLIFSSALQSRLALAVDQDLPKYETTETWKLIAPDSQTFILFEDQVNGKSYYSAGFYRGKRAMQTAPVVKENWQSWRTKFSNWIESLPNPKNCQHPYQFVVEKKNQKSKIKEFCYSEIMEDEKNALDRLAKDIEKSIYGT